VLSACPFGHGPSDIAENGAAQKNFGQLASTADFKICRTAVLSACPFGRGPSDIAENGAAQRNFEQLGKAAIRQNWSILKNVVAASRESAGLIATLRSFQYSRVLTKRGYA
jgi:hypothetical protein